LFRKRPFGVTVISALFFLLGIYDLLGGFANLAPPSQAATVLYGSNGVWFGLLNLIIAFGLQRAKRWAWTTALITAPISIVTNALATAGEWSIGVSGIAFFSVPSLLFAVIIILYLPRENAKDYFGKVSIREELL
jgi:hypothetical protein